MRLCRSLPRGRGRGRVRGRDRLDVHFSDWNSGGERAALFTICSDRFRELKGTEPLGEEIGCHVDVLYFSEIGYRNVVYLYRLRSTMLVGVGTVCEIHAIELPERHKH